MLGELPDRGADAIFPNLNLTGLYVWKRIIIYWHIFHSSGFHHICNIKCRLDCRYSLQNIFNAKNFNPHKKLISLLNVPICTQGMRQTWWPEAGTIIVTGPYSLGHGLNDHSLTPGLVLGLHPTNERRRYFVTTSLIDWAQTSNQPWTHCNLLLLIP